VAWSSDACPDEYGDDTGPVPLATFSSADATDWLLGYNAGDSTPLASCFGPSCPPPCASPSCVPAVGQINAAFGNARDMWLVGDYRADIHYPPAVPQPFASHYTNGAWKNISPPFTYTTQHLLNGATLLAGGALWAVGQRDTASGFPRTSILRRSLNGTWRDLGGLNTEVNGRTWQSDLDQIVHVQDTPSEMWAVGYAQSEDVIKSRDQRPVLLYHP
jgi:hypothetical protein